VGVEGADADDGSFTLGNMSATSASTETLNINPDNAKTARRGGGDAVVYRLLTHIQPTAGRGRAMPHKFDTIRTEA
jgi:hypothetical protein